MKKILIVLLIGLVAFSTAGVLAQKSFDDQYDIRELSDRAKEHFDFSKHDAIFLLDAEKNIWHADGRYELQIHRIIRIATEVGIEHYADHRVPYDYEHCEFKVNVLRTWRDGRWWESGSTAIVETLPEALRKAYDYANMREMMLLHDGVELSCIVEVAYTITDKQPFRGGMDGLWVFSRSEPAVKSVIECRVPDSAQFYYGSITSQITPSPSIHKQTEFTIFKWENDNIGAIPEPAIDVPWEYLPAVSWSYWNEDPLTRFMNKFTAVSVLNDTIKQQIDTIVEDSRTFLEKATLVAGFIEDKVEYVDYSDRYWYEYPRPAARTFETAYGHSLDRAILAAAIFNYLEMDAKPVFQNKEFNRHFDSLISYDQLTGVYLDINGSEFYYDPSSGELIDGGYFTLNRVLTVPMSAAISTGSAESSYSAEFNTTMTLRLLSENDTLMGSGALQANNIMNPYGQMAGVESQSEDFLDGLVASLIDGSDVSSFNPEKFGILRTVIGFDLEMEKPEADDHGRLKFELGSPSGGLYDHLPDHVHSYHNKRESPIYLRSKLSQRLEFKFDLDGYEPVYLPSDKTIKNDAGEFGLKVVYENDRVSINRSLNLTQIYYPPEMWPQLRELLLAEEHDRNRVVLFKDKADRKD